MLDLDAVRAFVKVAELASFTRAADQLGMPKSRVSLRVKALEADLGTRLLQRTTRDVIVTTDGEQFLPRARALVAEADELSAMFQTTSDLRGVVRVDLPVAFARDHVIPKLPELFAQHPHLELVISTTDRRVELVREGFDIVLRVGGLADSNLIAKRLGTFPQVNCASPAYLRRAGTPRTAADLPRHQIVHYMYPADSPPSFDYRKGTRTVTVPMRAAVWVNTTDAYLQAALAGLGIIQTPSHGIAGHLARGDLVEILPDLRCDPLPVSLVHAPARNLPKRVRAVMTWLADVTTAALRA